MTVAEKRLLVGGGVALVGAVAMLIFGERLIDEEVAVTIGLALAVAAAGLFGCSPSTRSGAAAAVGVALVLLAIYLPEIGADAAVKAWFGDNAGATERLDVVTLARWVLVVVGGGVVLLLGRQVVLEAALTAVAILALVAAGAAVIDLFDRVTTADKPEPAKADVTRSFALPADKVQSLTGDLAADACVNVVVVRAVDNDTADDRNALTYTHTTYPAYLRAKVAAGKPESAVKVELQEAGSVDEFATDLTAASAAYVLGCSTPR